MLEIKDDIYQSTLSSLEKWVNTGTVFRKVKGHCYSNRTRKYYRKFLGAVKKRNNELIFKYIRLYFKYAEMADEPTKIYLSNVNYPTEFEPTKPANFTIKLN